MDTNFNHEEHERNEIHERNEGYKKIISGSSFFFVSIRGKK